MTGRVLVVTSTYPQWEGDPRGAFIRTHWEQQAAKGADVELIAPFTAWCRGALTGAVRVRRFRYAPTALSSLSGHFGILENIRERPWRAGLVLPFWMALDRAVERALATGGFDRAVAHMLLPSGWIVAAHCVAHQVPFVLYGHGTDVDLLIRLPAGLRRRFVKRVRQAEAVYFPSADKLSRFRRALRLAYDPTELRVESMVHCVPGPDRGSVDWAEAEQRQGILYLGRLIPQKGVADLIDAVGQLCPSPELHIAGDGPEKRRLQRRAEQRGVRATFHGFVCGAEKDRLLRRSAVMCVPSRELRGGLSEGAPLVIIEGLASGLRIVATRVGGIPELCEGRARVTTVPPGDLQALAGELRASLQLVRSQTDPPLSSSARIVDGP